MDEKMSKNINSGEAYFIAALMADANVSYEELLKIKKIYEEMQSIAHFGTWEWDIKSDKCLLSIGVCNIYGIDKKSNKLDYNSFACFRHPDDRETVEQALRAAINERKPYGIGYRIVRTDGEIRQVFEYSSIVYGDNGVPIQAFGSIKDITQNLWMEQKLKESEHLYRTLFENTEDAFVIAELIYDKSGNICDFRLVQFNDMFEKQTGVKPENVAGRFAKGMQPGMEHHWIEMCESIMKAGKAKHYQEYSKASNRWYDVFGFPYKQGCLGAIFRDITQYKNAEQQLLEANKTSRLILDSINDGYGMFDRNGTILKVGRKFADRFGKTPEECEGMKLNDYLPDEKYAGLLKNRDKHISRVFDTGKLVEFQDTRDGRWYNHRCYPIFKEGVVSAVSIISTDITDTKKAEEEAQQIMQLEFEANALKKKEQEYLELLDGTMEGTRIIDFKAKRVEYSPKWAQRLGLDRFSSEELFFNGEKIIHKDDFEGVQRVRRDSETSMLGSFAHEYRISAGDSQYIWILDRGKVVYDKDGTVLKVYASSIDITESKNAQDKIKRQNTILQAINSIYERYVSCETMEQLGSACSEIINEVTGSSISFVTEMGQDGVMYEVAISPQGWGQDIKGITNTGGRRREFPVSGLRGLVIKSGKTLLTNDPASHPERANTPKGHPKIDSFLGVPFLRDGKVIGMVAAANREGGYTEHEKEILEAITPTICEVLLRKRSEEALSKALLRERVLGEITSSLLVSEDPQAIMQDICRKSIEYIEGDAFFNYICEEGRLHLNVCSGIREEDAKNIEWLEYGDAVCGCVARDGERIVGEDIQNSLDPRVQLVKSFGIQSYASFPLKSNIIIGTLSFASRKKKAFTEDELQFMHTVSEHITIAMNRLIMSNALRESEEKYRMMIDTAREGIVIDSPEGGYTYVNRQMAELLGYSTEEMIGKSGLDFSTEEMHPAILQNRAELSKGKFLQGDMRYRRKDGSDMWTIFNITPVFNAKGEHIANFAMHTDITERRKAEAALRISEGNFRAIFEQSQVGIAACDMEGRIILSNPAIEYMLGYSKDELHEMTFSDFTHPDDLDIEMPLLQGMIEGRTDSYEIEKRYIRKDKNIIWVNLSCTFMRGGDGERLALGIIEDITERKHAEDSLRESEERYRGVVENTSSIILRVSPEGIISFANRRALEFFGFTEDELLGKHIIGTIVPEREANGRDLATMVTELSVNPERFNIHANENMCKSGERVWVEWNNTVMYDSEGRMKESLCVGIDATERKRAEEALQESEGKYRELVENANSIIIRMDNEGVISHINEYAQSFFGYTREEAIGINVKILVPPIESISGRDLEEMADNILKNPDDFVVSINENIKKNGERVWVSWRNKAIRNADGGIIGNLAIGQDITQLKQAEEALRESEDRYRGVVQNTSAVILRVSPKGTVNFANKRALEFFGYEEHELIDKHVIGTIVPEREVNGRDLAAMTEKLSVDPESFNIHANENMCKSGERVWMEWNNTVIYDSEGRVKESLCVGIDATERKRAEEALRESDEHARILVSQLEEADRNKNAFLSALSHEIRNPLATISAGLQLMEISDDEAKIKGAKEIMGRQMDQLCSLVDELLDLTRITNNKIVLKKQRLELNGLVSVIAEDHKLLASEKGFNLEIKLSDSELYIDADPVRIKQIIGNLLHNAFKFTKADGEIVLSVSEESGHAAVYVRDSGIGIAAENLKRVFEPFTQIDHNIDRQGGGLGLGLSIVKGIAQLHGGDADAYSEGEGKGSCFCIRFPISKCEIVREQENTAVTKAKRLKVLFIEDNRDYSDMIRDLLSCLGHDTAAAFDGIEGIAKAKEYLPDLIICDIGLPGMDGYKTAKCLRKEEKLKGVFLIALSGYGGPRFAEAAQNAGFDMHISKPIDVETLRHILSRFA